MVAVRPANDDNALLEELHVGTATMFAAAGLTEVHRPSLRRAVYRVDL